MRCWVPNCFNYDDTTRGKISFFNVPRDPELRDAWIKALPPSTRAISRSTKICSAHFLERDIIICMGRRRLIKNAVPCLFKSSEDKAAQKTEEYLVSDLANYAEIGHVEESNLNSEMQIQYCEENLEQCGMLRCAMYELMTEEGTIGELQDHSVIDILGTETLELVEATELQFPYETRPNFDDCAIQELQGSLTAYNISKAEELQSSTQSSCQVEHPSQRAGQHKVKRRRTLKWALQCSDEEQNETKIILREKLAILRRHIKNQSAKIANLKSKCNRKSQKCVKISALLKSMTSQNFINEDDKDILANISESNRNLLEKQLTENKNVRSSKPYSEVVRKFAMNMNFYSPRGYVYLRESIPGLPHPRTIKRWYSSSNCEPGFSEESFIALRAAVQKASEENQKLVCNLVFDEMAVRDRIEWDRGKTYGYVDFGSGGDTDKVATQVLVYMVVCVNRSWKLPVGYFPISSITSEQKKNLLSHCIGLLLETGIVLLGVTFDGAANNVTLSRILGCDLKEDKSDYSFRLEGIDETFCIFPDACHMVKLVRNVLAELSPLVNASGQHIDWKYLVELEKLQDSEGLHLGNKVRRAHIYFQRQKMKVKLATQLFSRSVADAIDFCREVLKLPQFAGSEATSQFIIIINDAFDMLNSRKITDFGYKQALSSRNFPEISQYSSEICDYLRCIKLQSGVFLVEHRRRMGFVGLIACLRNLRLVYEKVLQSEILSYLPTYKLNQDPLEITFSSIRCRLGYNNNPTVRQLKAAYTQLLVHCQIRDGGVGNAIPLENISILQCSHLPSRDPSEQINASVDRFRMLDGAIADSTSQDLEEEIRIAYHTSSNTLSEYAENVVQYIAGFIVFKLQKSLHCMHCLSALESEVTCTSLIAYKSFGYLKTPSNCVKKICQVAEKMLRGAVASSKPNTTILNPKEFEKITLMVQQELMGLNLFASLAEHFHNNSHYGNLIKVITQKYLNVRFHAIARDISQKDSLRSFHHRLILFKNM